MTELSLLQKQNQNLSQIQIQAIEYLTLSNAELRNLLEKIYKDNPIIKIKYKTNIYETENVSSYAEEKTENYNKFFESLAEKRTLLSTTLEEQIHTMKLSNIENEIAERIIHSLDYNGFLSVEKDKLLEDIDLDNKEKVYYKMCDIISTLEPIGCATKDVYESLRKQFSSKYPLDNDISMLAYNLINKDDFESFSKGNLNMLSKKNATSKANINKAFSIIKELNPYPGAAYNVDYDKYIEADIKIKNTASGDIEIYIDDELLPIVEIDRDIDIQKLPKDEKRALQDYKNQVGSIISLLSMRSQTLLEISSFIINYQKDYIIGKKNTKKALGLKDISKTLELSESTVSRILNNHWAEYNGKTFPLRSLLEKKTFENNTQDYVYSKIMEIIKTNDTKLSDENIRVLLKEKYGIEIARRTVQKYRSKMNISSSYIRD